MLVGEQVSEFRVVIEPYVGIANPVIRWQAKIYRGGGNPIADSLFMTRFGAEFWARNGVRRLKAARR